MRSRAGRRHPMHRVSPASKRRKPALWPFWVLVLAWFCANTPGRLSYECAVWMAHARHFSHQERLKADVASLLGGHKANPLAALARSCAEPQPAAPAAATESLQKIDLYKADIVESVVPPTGASYAAAAESPLAGHARPEPLVPPPKGLTLG